MSFPTTPLLDNFNRANENPLSDGGQWTTKLFSTDQALALVSNACVVSSTGVQCGDFWNPASFTDSEVYVDVTVLPSGTNKLFYPACRTSNEGLSTVNAYRNKYDAATFFSLSKVISGAITVLGTSGQALSNGDANGLSVIGQALTAYARVSGVWQSVATATDSALASGHLALVLNDQGGLAQLDNFGGGTPVIGDSSTLTGVYKLQ